MNKTSTYKLKNISLALSTSVLTACLVAPLTASADTSSSVDAIMEQLKSLNTKAPAPKVSTPDPVVEKKEEMPEPKVEKKEEAAEPVEAPKKEMESVTVETAPVSRTIVEDKSSLTVEHSAVMIPEIKKSKVVRKKSKKRHHKKKMMKKAKSNSNNQGFDANYMALINQILNENPQQAKKSQHKKSMAATKSVGKGGVSGWIYLGRYTGGKWNGSSSLDSGSSLPQVGQQYAVKATLLNLRKSRPLKTGLGKLVKVLRVGEQVSVLKVHRSSRNNYWANITRP